MQKEITGPTLQDMKYRLNTDYESVSWAISGRGIGNFIGSVIGGVLLDKLGKYTDFMTCVWFVCMSGITIVLPWTLQVNTYRPKETSLTFQLLLQKDYVTVGKAMALRLVEKERF